MDFNDRKNELLETIGKLIHDKDDYTDKKKLEDDSIADKKKKADELEKAYQLVKEQRDEARSNYNSSKFYSDDYGKRIKGIDEKLEDAKRELARIKDAERINFEYLEKLEALREASLAASWRKENRTDGYGLFKHQIEGAIHLAVAKQALLADKRGTGKTGTALAYLDLVEAKKVVIISPSDTMDNFIREVQLWAPHRHVYKLGKMPKAQRNFVLDVLKSQPQFIVILNFEAWRKDKNLIDDVIDLQADTLVIDEAHHAKTIDTHVQKGIHSIRFGLNYCPNCMLPSVTPNQYNNNFAYCKNCRHEDSTLAFCSIKYVLPMTGTPILNKPQDLYPQLRLIDPANFKTEKNFLRDFCMQGSNRHWRWQWGAEKTLLQKLGPRYLARDRNSAGVEIPPVQHILHTIEWDDLEDKYPRQAQAYRQARDYAQIILDKEAGLAVNITVVIALIMRLRQVITWPAAIELKATDPDTKERYVVAKLDVNESAKIDKAEEIIREVVEEGERVVVFSQFREPLRELHSRFCRQNEVKSVIYDGSTSDYNRNQIQLDFDAKTAPSDARWDVVLGNYKAMGEGINLTGASQMIILDEEWNPGKQEQAYGRIDRIGQAKNTQIHTIRVDKTVDSWMAKLITEKSAMIGGFEYEGSKLIQNMSDAFGSGEL